MLIPNIPPIQQELLQVVIKPDGTKSYQMHPFWHSFLSQLTIELQNNASQEGIVIPKQSVVNIGNLNPANTNTFGAMLYDSDNHVAKININGVFKTITTS